jgi:CubicO group peptidase (beta-lactamase class C family)
LVSDEARQARFLREIKMRRSQKLGVAFAFLGVAMLSPAIAAEEKKLALDPEAEAQALRLVDAWLDVQTRLDQVPAMSAGVVRGQKLVWSKGYGSVDAQGKVPATARTLYSVCSITKLFTSVAVMQLNEARKVGLEDDLATLLPDFKLAQSDPDSGPITVRAALTHSGGVPREADFPYWSGPDFPFPTTAQIKEGLAQQKTIYRSGERFQYSNLGMTLLGNVVEKASGEPYEEYVRTRILDPLGMKETRYGLPLNLAGKELAVGYGSRQRDGTRPRMKPFKSEGLAPAAGLVTNVDDLARFVSWQFRLLKNGGTEILRASTLREMQRIQWTDVDGKTTWGLGFAVRYEGGKSLVSHTGGCPGYRTGIRMEPADELGIIVLTNTMEPTARYVSAISKILAKAKKIAKPKEDGVRASTEEYAGRYDDQPWSTEIIIVPWGENLAALSVPVDDFDTGISVLKRVEKDLFLRVRSDDTLGTEVRFERDARGKVVRFVSNSQIAPRLDE